MACFEEHLGKVEDIFESPQDVRCVRRVRELAKVRRLNPELYHREHVLCLLVV